jgi:hypothetical protein
VGARRGWIRVQVGMEQVLEAREERGQGLGLGIALTCRTVWRNKGEW